MKYVIRTWHCKDCKTYFKSLEAEPVCPTCAEVADPPLPPKRSDNMPLPSIQSTYTKNVDGITNGLMKDFNLTDMKDNQREGDTSAPPLTTSQRKLVDQSKSFWQGTGSIGSYVADGHAGVPKDHAMRSLQTMIKQKGL